VKETSLGILNTKIFPPALETSEPQFAGRLYQWKYSCPSPAAAAGGCRVLEGRLWEAMTPEGCGGTY